MVRMSARISGGQDSSFSSLKSPCTTAVERSAIWIVDNHAQASASVRNCSLSVMSANSAFEAISFWRDSEANGSSSSLLGLIGE
jgi:hypothetical protein